MEESNSTNSTNSDNVTTSTGTSQINSDNKHVSNEYNLNVLSEIKSLGDEWSFIDEKIKNYREDIKNLNNKKKELTDKIIDKMRTNDIKCIDVNDGFLECIVKPVPTPLKKEKVKESVNKYIKNPSKSSEITEFIFKNKEIINKDELKKIKRRKPRKSIHT